MGPGEVTHPQTGGGGGALPRILAGCAARQKRVIRRLESCAEGLLCPKDNCCRLWASFLTQGTSVQAEFCSLSLGPLWCQSPSPAALTPVPAACPPQVPSPPAALDVSARSCHRPSLLLALPLPRFVATQAPRSQIFPLWTSMRSPWCLLGPQAFGPSTEMSWHLGVKALWSPS